MSELEKLFLEIIEPGIPRIVKHLREEVLCEMIHLVLNEMTELMSKKELTGELLKDYEKIKIHCLKKLTRN